MLERGSRYHQLVVHESDVFKSRSQNDVPSDEQKQKQKRAADAHVFSSAEGYSTSQSSIFVNEGAWYFEVVISHFGESGHARVGWSRGNPEATSPLGTDECGYGYCDIGGEKVHRSKREAYGEAFAAGDVIGCYIYLTPEIMTDLDKIEGVPDPRAAREVHQQTNGTSDESADLSTECKSADASHEASIGFVAFCKNGKYQGIAYRLFERVAYAPTVSLYTHGRGELPAQAAKNFGPKFIAPVDFEGASLITPSSICSKCATRERDDARSSERNNEMEIPRVRASALDEN